MQNPHHWKKTKTKKKINKKVKWFLHQGLVLPFMTELEWNRGHDFRRYILYTRTELKTDVVFLFVCFVGGVALVGWLVGQQLNAPFASLRFRGGKRERGGASRKSLHGVLDARGTFFVKD